MKANKIWTWGFHGIRSRTWLPKNPRFPESAHVEGIPRGPRAAWRQFMLSWLHFLIYFHINPTWRWWPSHHVQQFIFRIINDIFSWRKKRKTSIKYLLVHMNFDFLNNLCQISDEVKLDCHQSRTVTLPSLHWQSLATLPHVRFLSYFSVSFLC